MNMNREFRIPLTLAAAGLTGCGGFQFEGVWDINRIEATYGGETIGQDFPTTYGGDTVSLELEATETDVTLTQTYSYEDGSMPYNYVQGPYDWAEVDDRYEIDVDDFDADSFICDADEDDSDKMTCTIVFDGSRSDIEMSRREE